MKVTNELICKFKFDNCLKKDLKCPMFSTLLCIKVNIVLNYKLNFLHSITLETFIAK